MTLRKERDTRHVGFVNMIHSTSDVIASVSVLGHK